jgi:carboxyl-terminal processing protease
MIVLIDHATASASEIVAGALQDWDRALIAGKSSFGKGLVQSQYRFADGSALLITTAKYYTPAGRLIQRSYANKTKDEYYFEAYDDSSIVDGPSGALPSALTAAGRTVYGGGGISPDVWVDTKEILLDEGMRRLYFSDQRVFYTYLKGFIERHPEVHENSESFIQNFAVSDSMLDELAGVAKALQTPFPAPLLAKNRKAIKFLLKRDLAYLLWGEVARLKINVEQDTQLREAIEHFPEARALLALSRRSASALRLPQK